MRVMSRPYILSLLAVLLLAPNASAGRLSTDLEQRLLQAGPNDRIPVVIRAVGTLSGMTLKRQLPQQYATRAEQHRVAVEALKATSEAMLPPIERALNGPDFTGRVSNVKRFWIDNVITAEMTPSAIAEISSRADVEEVVYFPPVELIAPAARPGDVEVATPADVTGSATPGLRAIKAPQAWAMGYTGKGRLVATLDTGVDGKHVLLSPKWRGHNGATVGESWFNPQRQDTVPEIILGTGANHGTWVMGIIVALLDTNLVGAPAGDTLGVSFDAEWISAAVIDVLGANILEALQWVADPDNDPNTDADVPDVVNNSWGVEAAGGGCEDVFWNAIDNVEAAGAVMLFAAGNEGPGAESIRNPANRIASETNAFSVGMIDASVVSFPVHNFSSRGPSVCDHATIKPEVVAPGVNIKTTHPNDNIATGGILGTSFSTPHVAGAVAILREYNPNATVDQIKTALLNSALDLGTAGPDNNYGHGLIDIEAALEVLPPNTQPALYVKEDYYTRPAPGGATQMVFQLRSAGTAVNDVSVTVTSQSPKLTVTDGTALFGNFAADGDTAANHADPFDLQVSVDVLPGERLPIQIQITGSGGYSKIISGAVQVGPARTDEVFVHTAGNIEVAAWAYGMFGLQPDAINPRFGGHGFFHGTDALESLFEGAFMLATDADHVSDNARDLLGFPDFDFQLDPGGRIEEVTPPEGFAEATRAGFSDNAAENPIGVFVEQRTMVSGDPEADDYLVAEYTIHNRSGATITDLHAGLFFDWDFPWLSGNSDNGDYDASEGLGWMKQASQERFRGLTVLSPPGVTSYRYFTNDPVIYDGFDDAEKWEAMTGGFGQTASTGAQDGSHLIATGPFTIPPDGSVTVAFAIIGAESETDLIASARVARSRYAGDAFTAVPANLVFQAVENGNDPASQEFRLHNTLPIDLGFEVTHVPAWASATPLTGDVASGDSTTVTVSATIAGITEGTYADSIVVTPDDPETEPIKINARLEVTSPGVIVPNPFDPAEGPVRMHFTIEQEATVRAKVYDITGADVATVQDAVMSAGSHDIKWDGKSSGGDVVANGVYFCHLEVDGSSGFEKTFTIVLKKE